MSGEPVTGLGGQPYGGVPAQEQAAGHGGAPRRRGPAAWVVVLLTLAAVGVVLLAFGAGVGVGVWAAGLSGSAPTSAAPALPAPGAPGAPDAPGATTPAVPDPGAPGETGGPGSLDPCLVGTWRTTEHEEAYDTEQGQATLTGLDRTMTFAADGTQTVVYEGSEATVTTDQGALPAVFDGQVVYRTTTTGSTMSFEVLQTEGTVTVLGPDGSAAQEEPLEPGTGDVTYTCDGDRFAQEATGYRSVYERVG